MYNKITFIGNLGSDPELKYTADGRAVCNFNVCASEKHRNKQTGAIMERKIWFKVSVWDGMAENVNKYLHKGSSVFVEGKLRADEAGNPPKWTDKEGVVRTTFEVAGLDVKFLGGGNGSGGAGNGGQVEDDGGLPF